MKLIEYQSFHDSFNKFRCKSFALFIASLSMAFETLSVVSISVALLNFPFTIKQQ